MAINVFAGIRAKMGEEGNELTYYMIKMKASELVGFLVKAEDLEGNPELDKRIKRNWKENRSTGAIAKYLGAARSSRMVGWALNGLNKTEHNLPAHRVVNRQGLLTGKEHFRGIPMEQLLTDEGVEIVNNQIQNLSQIYWDPNEVLNVE